MLFHFCKVNYFWHYTNTRFTFSFLFAFVQIMKQLIEKHEKNFRERSQSDSCDALTGWELGGLFTGPVDHFGGEWWIGVLGNPGGDFHRLFEPGALLIGKFFQFSPPKEFKAVNNNNKIFWINGILRCERVLGHFTTTYIDDTESLHWSV